MKDTIKAALITGVLGVVASTVTGIFSYKAGGEEVEQRIDNQVSQVVNVDTGDIDAAVEYLVSRVEELENENESLKSQSEEPTDKTDGSESADDTDSGQSMSEDNTSEKTDIFSLTPFKEGREDFIYSGAGRKDNIGNSYSTGYYITYDGLQNKNKEVCYLLDGKYKSLKGEIALDYVSKDVESEVWFEFYNGDKELGRTDSLCSGVKPVKVSIDVSQVDELTIRVNGGNQRSSILTEGFYLE